MRFDFIFRRFPGPANRPADSKRRFLWGIQIMRGLAALMVVFGHILHEARNLEPDAGVANILESLQLFPWGAVGVHIFFVISGFVIVYTSPKMAGSLEGIKLFLLRRFTRVVPLYWFYTSLMILALFVVPAAIGTARIDWMHFLQSYLFIPHDRPAGGIRPVLSLGWTLNYEIYFYLVFGLFLCWGHRTAFALLALFFVLTTALGFAAPESWSAIYFWTRPVVFAFLAGAGLAMLYLRDVVLPRIYFWPLMAAGMAILSLLIWPGREAFSDLAVMIAAGVIFLTAAGLTDQKEHNRPPGIFAAMGNSSYSLYLSHPFILGLLQLAWVRLGLGDYLSIWIYVAGTVGLSVVGAHILYLLIERPMLRQLNRKLSL